MRILKKQEGVSLIVALVVLLIITILGISAARLSSQDLIIASNEQQQMMVSQASESARSKTVSFYNLFQWLENRTEPDIQTRSLSTGSVKSEITVDVGEQYVCYGQSGEAMSVGAGASLCRVYTFSVDSRLIGTGAYDRVIKGEGKELPSTAGNGL